ncbi:MAG: hypothetical protein Q8P38_04590 [Candidatus Nanopelagicales bacterium]|nr:hypothetical protein [Candidatus Nanopelagicales bacterium]
MSEPQVRHVPLRKANTSRVWVVRSGEGGSLYEWARRESAAPGVSAAGIISGLSAIGGLAGGRMAAGVGILVAAPVVAAGAVGAGIYFGGRSIRRRRQRKRGPGESPHCTLE